MPSEQQLTDRFRAAHYAHLRHMAIFALVVEAGSFTLAAERLGLGKSSVSRHVSELEAFFGVRLLARSTRSLSLTDAGRRVFPDCARLVEAATRATDRIDGDLPLEGTLRIASTVEHGQYVLPPIVAAFVAANPGMDVELVLGDAFIDLVDQRIDLAIRVGTPGPSPQNISRKIAEMTYRLYGNADFLASVAPITTPEEAAAHPWLLNAGGPRRTHWQFERAGVVTAIQVPSRVISNAFNARVELAKFAPHLIAIPDFLPQRFLEPGLRPVLPEYRIVPSFPIYAVYPDARFLPPKVAEFLELLHREHP